MPGINMKVWITGFFLLALGAVAQASDVPMAKDLARDARVARATGRPIMVFFMSEDCSYCEEVRELYLEPMIQSGTYKGRVIIRMVDVDGGTYMLDFKGKKMPQEDFASAHGASFTPVIKFFDSRGRELVPEILGYTSPDFYQAYLDRAIKRSLASMRKSRVRVR